MSAAMHDGGVDTHRDRSGLASAWGLCDCGWRGQRHYGEDAGVVAFTDREGHLSSVGEPAMSSGELAVLRAEFNHRAAAG